MTDPLGKSLSYSYDGSGELVAVTDRNGNTSRYTYNTQHALVSMVDAAGVTHITGSKQPGKDHFTIRQNWSPCSGMSGHDRPEQVVTFTRNTHRLQGRVRLR